MDAERLEYFRSVCKRYTNHPADAINHIVAAAALRDLLDAYDAAGTAIVLESKRADEILELYRREKRYSTRWARATIVLCFLAGLLLAVVLCR